MRIHRAPMALSRRLAVSLMTFVAFLSSASPQASGAFSVPAKLSMTTRIQRISKSPVAAPMSMLFGGTTRARRSSILRFFWLVPPTVARPSVLLSIFQTETAILVHQAWQPAVQMFTSSGLR